MNGIISFDTITIIVKPKPVKPTIIELNGTLLSYTYLGNQWFYNNLPIQGANNNFLIPVQSGYYYTIITNNAGCISIPSDSIYMAFTGINNFNFNNEISISPNPVSNSFIINTDYKINQIDIFDIRGKKVETYIDIYKPYLFNAEKLNNGIYFVKVYFDNMINIIKLVKY